jgi:hypothetical protein
MSTSGTNRTTCGDDGMSEYRDDNPRFMNNNDDAIPEHELNNKLVRYPDTVYLQWTGIDTVLVHNAKKKGPFGMH